MKDFELGLAKQVLRLRLSQMIINERYKNGDFKIPIHLAFGHEAIAVAVDSIMEKNDKMILHHRNIHYNLSKVRGLKATLEEYYLNKDGLAKGKQGSMNLCNPEKNIPYSSSILGNNLAVGSGVALGQKINNINGVAFIVVGDGGIEEGSFYESLLFQKSNRLSVLIIIENNQWSLATRIDERRCEININKLADSLDVNYIKLEGNDLFHYIKKLKEMREFALTNETTVCIEVKLTTLGSWYMKTKEYPNGKFINYHAGPAPTVNVANGPVITESKKDPVYVLKKYFSENNLKTYADELLTFLYEDIK